MPTVLSSSNTSNYRASDDTNPKKAATVRRTLTRQPPKSKLAGSITADQLVNELASKLTLNDGKGKQRAEESSQDTKASSMRSMNSVSQTLTGIIQSGWRKSSSDSASRATLVNANSSASAAAKHLAILRRLCPNDVDVERAAVSVLGKLVTLEMVRFVFISCFRSLICFPV
jgi:separase